MWEWSNTQVVALQATRDSGDGNHDNKRNQLLLSGLSEAQNCLASRRRGQHHLPITIFKSKYAKNSSSYLVTMND